MSYVSLATTTLGNSTSSVTFSSIPATYKDLVLVVAGTASTQTGFLIKFNGDNTESNYFRVLMLGNGSTTSSSTGNNSVFGSVYTVQSSNITSIMDYSATDKHKTLLLRSNSASDFTYATAGRWANTAAITSINLSCSGATFSIGTTFSLYGVA
jgi:hypothetical protein